MTSSHGPEPEQPRPREGAPAPSPERSSAVGAGVDPGPDPKVGGSGGPSPGAGRRRRGYWIPGLIAVAALTVIGVAFGAGDLNHSRLTVLYGRDMAQEIALGIQDQEGAHSLPDVRCPGSEPVRDGWRFVCTRQEPGKAVPIQVVEIDSRGHLRWSQAG